MVPDVLAVMDAAGMERAALLGWADAAGLAMTVAARHPERVSALVLGETLATTVADQTHPWGLDPVTIRAVADAIEGGMWGQAIVIPFIAPSSAGGTTCSRPTASECGACSPATAAPRWTPLAMAS